MVILENIAKTRLERGELAIGVGLRQARTVDIAKIMKTAGYDFLFIDLEHGAMDLDTAGQICCAAQDKGITPVVRVPSAAPHHAAKALDAGAQGIVLPHVDTAEVAAGLVKACRYPPLGQRSIVGGLPQLDFAAWPIGEATEAVNAATLVIPMIETPAAVANVETIAAVEGVDVLLVGCNDLSLAMDLPGQLEHPDLVAALERVVAACRAHGIQPGLGGVYQPALMERYIRMGFRLVIAGNDLAFMLAMAKQRAEALRSMAG